LIRGRSVRCLLAACLLGWLGTATTAVGGGGETLSAAVAGAAADFPFDLQTLNSSDVNPSINAVAGGSLDSQFAPLGRAGVAHLGGEAWLKLTSVEGFASTGIPVVVMHAARQMRAELYVVSGGSVVSLPRATRLR